MKCCGKCLYRGGPSQIDKRGKPYTRCCVKQFDWELTSWGGHRPSAHQRSPALAPQGHHCHCRNLDTHSSPAHLTHTWIGEDQMEVNGKQSKKKCSQTEVSTRVENNAVITCCETLLTQHQLWKCEVWRKNDAMGKSCHQIKTGYRRRNCCKTKLCEKAVIKWSKINY